MQHRTLDELTRVAKVADVTPVSSPREMRRARLRRLATLLENHEGPIRLRSPSRTRRCAARAWPATGWETRWISSA
jgi:hypothetical protein